MKKILSVTLAISIFTLFTSCSKDATVQADASQSGVGGSMARFAVVGDYLYTVNSSDLEIIDIKNPASPNYVSTKSVGFGIETIFPYNNHLFIGAQTGMYIYDISSPANPNKLSQYEHIYSCDPVVVQDDYAYVTLHSENSWCGRFTDELHIIDISNLNSPQLLTTYTMGNPLGLGVDGNNLFVCDEGLKVYDITNKQSIELKQHFKITAYDVIPYTNLLIVIGDNGLYQYDYSGADLTLLSTIN
ncbi:MAG: hypothetical protein ABFS35_05465 [Bacteroidota bacterium]